MTSDAKGPVQPGDVVAGKYRIERELGAGGMGVVMAARHLTLDEPVALKFVTDGRDTDREAMARMMREARATFRLRSEHTVRVMDVGELPSGPLYIVMELLEGRDLRAELRARGPLPESEAVRYALEACDALEEAHAMGIIHRDLKPHNLFLAKTARGTTVLKVLDFGMSKLDPEQFEKEAAPLTRPETALGTPRYMAPEQWKSAAAVDARADVWALGVVLYELLVGEPPLGDVKGAERIARVMAGAIEPPNTLRPEISDAVSRAIMRCLRADPNVRWPSVAHFRTALQDAHPQLAARSQARADIKRTEPTVAVPADVARRNVAAAFAPEGAVVPSNALPISQAPRTRPATPAAMPDLPPSRVTGPATEVRAPLITPPPVEAAPATTAEPAPLAVPPKPPSSVLPTKPMKALKPNAETLRSAAARPLVDAAIAAHTDKASAEPSPHPPPSAGAAAVSSQVPNLKTLPMPGAPARPGVAPTAPGGSVGPAPQLASSPPLPASGRPAALAATGSALSGPASMPVASQPAADIAATRLAQRNIAIAAIIAVTVLGVGAVIWALVHFLS